jgi:hypothetical protein
MQCDSRAHSRAPPRRWSGGRERALPLSGEADARDFIFIEKYANAL